MPGCQADDDCLDFEYCGADSRCDWGCRGDEGCEGGEICAEGACVPGCRDDAACRGGHICRAQTCVPGCRVDVEACEAALPTLLIGGGGLRWSIDPSGAVERMGIIFDAFTFFVSRPSYQPFRYEEHAVVEMDGQQLVFGPQQGAAVQLSRRVYASPDAPFIRYLHTFENLTDEEVRVMAEVRGVFEPGSAVGETSSGDGVFERDDAWLTVDGDEGHAFVVVSDGRDGPPLWVTTSVPDGRFSFTTEWSFTAQPGQAVHLMYFLALAPDQESLATVRDVLLALGPETRVGLSEDVQRSILNFGLPP